MVDSEWSCSGYYTKKLVKFMKVLLCSFVIVFTCLQSISQKPIIDTSTLDKWSTVSQAGISNDGNYFRYTIYNQSTGSTTLCLQKINSSWKVEIPNAGNATFTDDSQKALFVKFNDSLCLYKLNNSTIEYIPNVVSFKLFKYREY